MDYAGRGGEEGLNVIQHNQNSQNIKKTSRLNRITELDHSCHCRTGILRIML